MLKTERKDDDLSDLVHQVFTPGVGDNRATGIQTTELDLPSGSCAHGLVAWGVAGALTLAPVADGLDTSDTAPRPDQVVICRAPEVQWGAQRNLARALSVAPSADQVKLAIRALGIGKSRLAEVLGVTRQAVYDWLGGKDASGVNAERLLALSTMLAEPYAKHRRPLFHRYVSRSVEPGEASVLDLLKQAEWDESRLQAALDRAWAATIQRDERAGNAKPSEEDDLLDSLLALGVEV